MCILFGLIEFCLESPASVIHVTPPSGGGVTIYACLKATGKHKLLFILKNLKVR